MEQRQQRMRRFAFFVGGSFLVAGGLFAVACGTDNGSGSSGALPTPDSSKSDTAQPGVDSATNDSGGTDSGADCANVPKVRATPEAGTFFCPFKNADGGNTGPCQATETCCNPGKGGPDGGFYPSFCAPGAKGADTEAGAGPLNCAAEAPAQGSAWPLGAGGTSWECFDKTQCPNGNVCCLFGSVGGMSVNIGLTNDTATKACGAQKAYKEEGTTCRTTCRSGEYKLCSLTDQNCGAGTTCTGVSATGRDLGFCK